MENLKKRILEVREEIASLKNSKVVGVDDLNKRKKLCDYAAYLLEQLERYENVTLTREARRNLGSDTFRLMSKVEKDITLKALNDYEHSLITDIKRANNNGREYVDEGIFDEYIEVNVPVDLEKPDLSEFLDSGINETLETKIVRVEDAIFHISSYPVDDRIKGVFLKALHEYKVSIQNLRQQQSNNQALYEELEESKQVGETYTPMSQSSMFQSLYNKYKTEEGKGSK